MRIAIDIDGIVADFVQGFCGVINKIRPGLMPDGYSPPDWDFSDLVDKALMNAAWKEVKRTEDFWCDLVGDKDNVRSLRRFLLDVPTVDVYYVTSRIPAGSRTALAQTNEWLTQRGLLAAQCSTIVMPDYIPGVRRPSKGQIYKTLDIGFSIDDYPKNVTDAILHTEFDGHSPYLLDRTWNRADTDLNVFRVHSLEEYLDKVHTHNWKEGR